MSTKTRMVDSAVALLREQGVGGVTIDAVLAHSGAPRGSVYHHFPGGRAELVLTAGRTASDFISHLMAKAASSQDPGETIEQFVAFWRAALEATDYRAGCPIVALAVGARDLPEADDLARETFQTWHGHLTRLLRAHGHTRSSADAEATFIVAAIEGAVVLCKAERSAKPLDQVVTILRRQFAPEIGADRASRPRKSAQTKEKA